MIRETLPNEEIKKADYMKNKKTHKWSRMKDWQNEWIVRPICKVDNKTLAYKASTHWYNVDCKKCLEKKDLK